MRTHTSALSRRRLLGLGAAAAAGAALSACGGPAPQQGGGGDASLRLLTPIFDRADGQKLLTSLLADFKKDHPGVSVQVDYTEYGKLNEKLATSIVGGQPYDVMLMGVGWIPPFVEKGVLADLGTSRSELESTYNPRVVEPGIYEGGTYGRPILLDTRIGIYRKDILAEAGIGAPPKDMTELMEMGKELTVREGGKLTRAGVDILSNDLRQTYLPVMWAHGGDLFADGKPVFDSDEAVEALQWMVDVIRTEKIEDYGFTQKGAVVAPLIQGRAAMMIGHNDMWRQASESAPELIEEDRIGGFMLNQRRPALFQGGTLATMSAKTKHPEQAKALVEYLSGEKVSPQAAEQRGNIPAVLSAADSEYVRGNKLISFAVDNLDHAFSEGGVPAWLEIREEFKPALESALLGKSSPADSLRGLAETAEAIIAKGA
ncbi:ABC transporter substrate-binding protein [Streptomyces verrucosisporus]|uniref:ABC transporter substrate-binding protein n=1 Tax=Streptomyces verrucosisporus TaxID=1695161 RepID=UPI0019CFAF57|nr:ABC transporter substrate-binding protein [Streptomyces verrucosisporus]MBN3928268.1 ABC transporter substrate-binding protein [Streptomyces verrucosisporus]